MREGIIHPKPDDEKGRETPAVVRSDDIRAADTPSL